MFARIKKVKNGNGKVREYLLIVKNEWIKGRTVQRTVANLGRMDVLGQKDVAQILIEKLQEYHKIEGLINAEKSQCDWAKEYGVLVILRRVWEQLGLDELLNRYLEKYRYKKDLGECLLAMVMNRLIEPESEHGLMRWLQGIYEPRWEGFGLNQFYRALDFLSWHKKDLEKDLFFKTTDLFSQQLDLVMFDTTSMKYWGEGKDAEILQYGYSKEKRGDLKQLIVGILMTREGYPIGCEIFPGNTSDLKSFLHVIEQLKVRYNIGRLVWVADRGMVSRHNIEKLKELKQDYILGVRMRQFSKARREEFLNPKGMWEVKDNLYVKEIYVEGEGRYIICYNPQEAENRNNKRQYFKHHINKKLATTTPKDWMIKNAYKKYVDFEGTVEFNDKKFYEDKQYDGYWVLLTNTQLSTQEVALYYKRLWQLESGFRDLKSELVTAPIYHYKERRIIAHIFVAFLALLVKITLKKKIKAIDPKASYSEVFEAVRGIKAVKINCDRQEVIFRTEFPPKAYLAFQALGVAPPPRIISYQKRPSLVSRQDLPDLFSSTK
jgi:transposase